MTLFLRARWTAVSAAAALALLLTACNKGQQPAAPAAAGKAAAAPDAVAVVDGKPIPRSAFDDYLKSLLRGKPAADLSADDKNQVLDQMINMQIISAQAEKDGMDKDPDVIARLALLRMQVLADAGAQKYLKTQVPTDQELHAEYDAADKTEYHARHILLQVKDEKEDAAVKAKAEALIKKIKAGAKFEDVAKAESSDNSKNNGGDLGWFSLTRMVKPFGDAVKILKKGEMTQEPVRTQFGWHIIKLEDSRDTPFEQMKPQLSNALVQKKFQAYLDGLKKNAKIEKKL